MCLLGFPGFFKWIVTDLCLSEQNLLFPLILVLWFYLSYPCEIKYSNQVKANVTSHHDVVASVYSSTRTWVIGHYKGFFADPLWEPIMAALLTCRTVHVIVAHGFVIDITHREPVRIPRAKQCSLVRENLQINENQRGGISQ